MIGATAQPTPETLADIHQSAFQESRPWTTDEFHNLLSSKHVFVISHKAGFAMGRVVIDEVELLTIAVVPAWQAKGIGRRLLEGFEAKASERGATYAFLEVAEDNPSARALYISAGWGESGRRKGYYARKAGKNVDAILFQKKLTLREPPEK